MPKTILLRGAVLLFAASFPIPLLAQFQQPTDEELKMTADPKAPGAAAVYLDIEENANDPLHYQSYYFRIKVLTEKGKELATVNLPYMRGNWKVSGIEGRTIHSDGTVIPLNVKPEDLLGEKIGQRQVNQEVFTLPSVEVGSILEYRYQFRYDDNEFDSPLWRIQGPYFVHKAHFQFTPFKEFMPTGTPGTDTNVRLLDSRGRVARSLIWWSRLPPGNTVKTSVNGSYSIDLTDIPASPDEEWMPPIEGFLYKVQFYYSYTSSANEFWPSEGKLWSKDVDKFAEPSNAIKTTVNGIISATDSDLDKAKKLYDAVEALDNTDYSRKKGESEMKQLGIKEAKHAQDTLVQKSGNSEDIAMLYLAMLRAAGLTAYASKIVDRDRALFDQAYLGLDQLDSTVISLSTGGKEITLDPGEKMCPFQTVSWRHSYATGLGQGAQGPVFVTIPMQQYKDNTVSRTADLTLDAHGGVTGTVSIIMTGQAALHWRQAALRNDDTELKKQFDRDLEGMAPDGIEAHVDHFLGIDQPDANLIAMVKVSGSMGAATAKRLLLPAFFFSTRSHEPFVNQEKRLEPVDMHYGDRVSNQVTYHLPAGMAVEGAPQDANISWPAHALFVVKSKTAPGTMVIGDSLARAFTIAKPEEYQDLRGFYQKVDAAFQGQLVLTFAPVSASALAPASASSPVAIPAASPAAPAATAVTAVGKGN